MFARWKESLAAAIRGTRRKTIWFAAVDRAPCALVGLRSHGEHANPPDPCQYAGQPPMQPVRQEAARLIGASSQLVNA
jgi:hypothetical protein